MVPLGRIIGLIYCLYLHHFIASGFYPPRSISGKPMDGPSTHYPYPSLGVALTSRSKGLRDMFSTCRDTHILWP